MSKRFQQHNELMTDSPGPQHATLHDRPTVNLVLRTRSPYDAGSMRAFLAAHAIPGRDQISATSGSNAAGEHTITTAAGSTAHALDVPGGTAVARVDWGSLSESGGFTVLRVQLTLPTASDEAPATEIIRRMLDLDADPAQIAQALGADPRLAELIATRPGLRLPGARNEQEFALGVVLGQQVSLAAARTLQGRLAACFASEVGQHGGEAEGFHAALDVARIAETDSAELRERIGLTAARAETLRTVARALAEGLDLRPGADHELARASLLKLKGIGPWSVELIAMRALGDVDAYPAGDLVLRRVLGTRTDRETKTVAESWRPYRGYATQHLWAGFLAEQAARVAK